MSVATTTFYVTGGTLPHDALCYVSRSADTGLLAALERDEFCYVLTSRQMGKSSLMVRAAVALRSSGCSVAVIDLTEIGNNVTAAQWYRGLLGIVGAELGLEEKLADFWRARDELGPLQRWLAAIREVIVAGCPGRVVIFVDEIDAVRSLAFSTDEFFAGIRHLYNRRSEDPELCRLTFCLLGVAIPSDLIKDTRSTPFNIGQRIELNDFTEGEAANLASGLRRAEQSSAATLGRILHWTGGHPYLTQRLCRAVADESDSAGPTAVDRLCDELFLSPRARERDDNLMFVRERILRSELDAVELLGFYQRVLAGRRVQDHEKNPAVNVLRLSGIVRAEHGLLRVRNPIYETAFDRAWVRSNMPGAELRRQRLAFFRGLTAATAVGLVIIGAMGFLMLNLRSNRRRLEEQQRVNRRVLYIAHMNVAQQAWEQADVGRAITLLEAHRPRPGEDDLRAFEWYYLWRLCHGYLREFTGHTAAVMSVAFSPDGRMLATASWDGTARLWDVATGRELLQLATDSEHVFSVAFSPDGKILATGEDLTAKLWDVESGRQITSLAGHVERVNSVAFSPDGSMLASASSDKTVKLWRVATGNEIATFSGHARGVNRVVFSADGRMLASASGDGSVRLWDIAHLARPVVLPEPDVASVSISPDGRLLATGGWYNSIGLWDVRSRRRIAELRGHTTVVDSVSFSPDGRLLVSSSHDGTARIWNIATRQEMRLIRASSARWPNSAVFSPDGQTVAVGDDDKTARLWSVFERGEPDRFVAHEAGLDSLQFSPDGSVLATAGRDKEVKLWSTGSWNQIAVLQGHTDRILGVSFSADGRLLATSGVDHTTRIWELPDCRPATVFIHDGSPALFFPNDDRLLLPVTRYSLHVLRAGSWLLETAGEGDWIGWPLAISPDGKILVTGTDSGPVRLWDAKTLGKLGELGGHTDLISGAAFSPDGHLLATASYDGTTRLWDFPSLRPVAILKGHMGWVRCVAFSPDGRRLATGGLDMTVKLWDVATHDELITLRVHTGLVTAVAFSPDGLNLASSSLDGTVRLWRAAPR